MNGIRISHTRDWTPREGHVLMEDGQTSVYDANSQEFRLTQQAVPIPMGSDHTPGLETDPSVAPDHAVIKNGELHSVTDRTTRHSRTSMEATEPIDYGQYTRLHQNDIIRIGAWQHYRYNIPSTGTLDPMPGHTQAVDRPQH